MAQDALAELAESFGLFDDWEDRYRYIIELGQAMPRMDDVLKVDSHLVRGCTSKVWLVAARPNGTWHFEADSDAVIVRGLIAILLRVYQDRTASEIRDIEIEPAFERLGLVEHLSPSRRNGFFAMVERIRSLTENQ